MTTELRSPLAYPHPQPPPPAGCTTVAPGVHWLRMPLPFALDHINLWALDDAGGGLTLVDAGIAREPVMAHWRALLEGELAGRRVRRVIVTHYHPDHLGLASWLAAEHGVPVLMTQAEFLTAHAVHAQLPGYSSASMVAQFRAHGLDDDRLEALAARGNPYRRGVPELPPAYQRIMDGEALRIGAHDWQVRVGYGHSPEHAALYCAELGVLISGDMVLPRISTNISVWAAAPEADPLRLFLDSLARYALLPGDTLVLPSHGLPFRGLQARVAQLEEHHAERCTVLLDACAHGASAGELLSTLFPRELDTHQVMFAMGEAIAHLNHLAHAGRLVSQRDDDGRIRYVKPH